jgi:hypothetical protein
VFRAHLNIVVLPPQDSQKPNSSFALFFLDATDKPARAFLSPQNGQSRRICAADIALPDLDGDTRPRFRHAHVQNIGTLSETRAMSCS